MHISYGSFFLARQTQVISLTPYLIEPHPGLWHYAKYKGTSGKRILLEQLSFEGLGAVHNPGKSNHGQLSYSGLAPQVSQVWIL